MADLSEYTFFEGVEIREEVKTLMQIFEDSLEECIKEDCRQCKYRHGKEQYALMACISERYAENLIDADVAPVVRCGECKYYIRELMSPGSGWCECLERGEYEKHFCSYGERKEGAEDG